MRSQRGSRAASPVGHNGWLALAAVAGLSTGLAGAGAALAQDVAPITIVINQSPWFEGFRGLVEYYEEQTGNQVELDVNPFAGSIEKQRSSARAPQGTIDLFTEFGRLELEPGWIGLVPRGVRFRVSLKDKQASGYVAENFGAPFRLPELGPIGSNGLANPRDFEIPQSAFEDRDGTGGDF